MEALNKKLERLQLDKEKIEREIAAINEQRQTALYDYIKTLMPVDIDPMIIVGGLLSVFEQAQTNPSTAEVWRQVGQKFRRQQSTSRTNQRFKAVSSRSATIKQASAATATSHTAE